MASVAVGAVLQVIQTWSTPLASVAQNVWHLVMESGAGADTDDILPAVLTQQQTAFAFVAMEINTGFEVELHELRLWDPAAKRFDGVASQTASAMAGLSGVDFNPHGVAALGRIITAFARRQGRTFIPGVDEGEITGGLLSVGMEASLAS